MTFLSKCKTPGCPNSSAQYRTVCYTCKSKTYREKYPEKRAYIDLRNNARRRGKEFNLTFDGFQSFCQKVEYMNGRGRTKESLHIDRIDESKGYSVENIQVLSNSKNVKKYIEYIDGVGLKTKTYGNKTVNNDDIPF